MKHFFAGLLSLPQRVELVRDALRFKEKESKFEKKSAKKKIVNEINDTMALDDVSIICPKQEGEDGQNCGCVYYDLSQ